MVSDATTLEAPPAESPLRRFLHLGFCPCSRVQLSWSMAGGVGFGGVLVAVLVLMGQVSVSFAPQLTAIFFVAGALAGLVHGALLGYVGREPCRTRGTTVAALLAGLPWVVPALVLSWVVSTWITLVSALSSSPTAFRIAGVVAGWLAGAAICGWAAVEGVGAVRRVYTRWPEYRMGTLITAGLFLVLAVLFVAERPEIWFTDVRVTGMGAVILALGATVWIGLPTIVLVLRVVTRIRDRLLPATS